MKPYVLLFLVVMAVSGCASGRMQVSEAQDKAQILAATDAWRAAYNSRDASRIVAAYGKDAVFWGTTMKAIATTPDGIADYFKDAARRPAARVEFTEQVIRIYGDVAFSSGTYTFTDVRDGKAIVNPSRYSMVFHREGEQWTLVHHHSSRMP